MDYVDLQHFLALDLPYFEPVNIRRGGWSGVARTNWANEVYFVKRQVNHSFRDPSRLFRKTPTLRREYRNFLRLAQIGIRTPEVVLYADKAGDAMMVTRELTGYVDLVEFLRDNSDSAQRTLTIKALLSITLNLHSHSLHHGCLYGKHIMVNTNDPGEIAMIDLEKLKYSPRKRHIACKDISQLIRQTLGLSPSERDIILSAYEAVFPDFLQTLNLDLKKKNFPLINTSSQ